MSPSIGWLIAIVILLLVLFPIAVSSFTRKTLAYAEQELAGSESFESTMTGPWHNFTKRSPDDMVYNSIAIDFDRELLFLTLGADTRVEKIHSVNGVNIDDRASPYYFPTKTYLTLSFGPNLDILRLYKPNCGILEARINNEHSRTFYSDISSAKKYPYTDVSFRAVSDITVDKSFYVADPYGHWFRQGCTPMMQASAVPEEIILAEHEITLKTAQKTTTYATGNVLMSDDGNRTCTYETSFGSVNFHSITPTSAHFSINDTEPVLYYKGEGFTSNVQMEDPLRSYDVASCSRRNVVTAYPLGRSAAASTIREMSTLS